MPTITAIEAQKRQRGRLNIYVDGSFAFSLDAELAQGLRPGQALSPQQLADLSQADDFQQCYQAALRFLGYRPRSLAEVTRRLQRRAFAPEAINQAIHKLQEQGMLSDEAFARFWQQSRETFSPRSRYLIQAELRQKGVAPEMAAVVTQGMDEMVAARRAAAKKARSLGGADEEAFRKKLAAFLRRRGFSWEVIRGVVGEMAGQRTGLTHKEAGIYNETNEEEREKREENR